MTEGNVARCWFIAPLDLLASCIARLPQPMFPARYDADKAWIQSFDWSRDGLRLVVAMGRWVEAHLDEVRT